MCGFSSGFSGFLPLPTNVFHTELPRDVNETVMQQTDISSRLYSGLVPSIPGINIQDPR